MTDKGLFWITPNGKCYMSKDVYDERVKKIEDLKAQVEQLRLDRDIGAKDYCDLMGRHDALVVQVDRLRELGSVMLSESDDETAAVYMDRFESALKATPTQCLAEIKAQAVEDLTFPVVLRKMWSSGEVHQWLKNEADQLRQQAKEK